MTFEENGLKLSENVFEFILWENCHNRCDFCVQKKENFLKDQEKSQSVKLVKAFIESSQFIPSSHVLVLGGEIFDDKKDSSLVLSLFDFLVEKMKSDYIKTLYFNTNLIYKYTNTLFTVLEKISKNNLEHRIHFTTSYDLIYRFKGDSEKRMLGNIREIHKRFPKIRVIVNTILTDYLVKSVLGGEFSVKDFSEENDVWVNLIPYVGFENAFKPDRKEVFRALRKIDKEFSGNYLPIYLGNMLGHSVKHLYTYNKITDKLINIDCDYLDCNHSENFKLYSKEGNSCYACDLNRIFREGG